METSAVQSLKLHVIHALGLSRDAMHVHIGLIVFFLVAFAMRRKTARLWPLLAVLVVAILGEVADLRDDLNSFGFWRWRASLHDIVNTVFWPGVLTLLVRTRRVAAPRTRAAEPDDETGDGR